MGFFCLRHFLRHFCSGLYGDICGFVFFPFENIRIYAVLWAYVTAGEPTMPSFMLSSSVFYKKIRYGVIIAQSLFKCKFLFDFPGKSTVSVIPAGSAMDYRFGSADSRCWCYKRRQGGSAPPWAGRFRRFHIWNTRFVTSPAYSPPAFGSGRGLPVNRGSDDTLSIPLSFLSGSLSV